jgi:S-adenosylmethionine synthetase
VTVMINMQTKRSGRPYLVTGGSCTDFGEEGAVGRGNKTHGIVASFRPNTMEAPHGKNATYFVGKVLGYQADIIAKSIYETLQTNCQVIVQANIGDDLYNPSKVMVSTEQPVALKDVEAVVETCLGLGRKRVNILQGGSFSIRRSMLCRSANSNA